MKIAIAGATGFIGKHLCKRLLGAGDEVFALSRDAKKAGEVLPKGVKPIEWNPLKVGPWAEALSGLDGVVNLAGEMMRERRWSEEVRRRMVESRVNLITTLVDAMASVKQPPRVIVSASAVSYYGDGGDEILTEDARPDPTGLASKVCADGELEAMKARERGIRPVAMRIGFVLGLDGGPLEPVLVPFRYYLGARLGRPTQWIPWIHIDDQTGFIEHALKNDQLDGPYNLTAPNPVMADEFFRTLGRVLGRPCWFHLSDSLLRKTLGELAPLMLSSLRVSPKRAEQSGYKFAFPTLEPALQNLLAKKK